MEIDATHSRFANRGWLRQTLQRVVRDEALVDTAQGLHESLQDAI
jgi:hypothetical protein